MSSNLLYWLWLGCTFVITIGTGLVVMRTTRRYGLSAFIAACLGVILTVSACVWWSGLNLSRSHYLIGLLFYIIAFVNMLLLTLFILMSLRKKGSRKNKSV